jgi:hypothetical protein
MMKYKKYIVFAYEQYYPSGGMGDIVGSFDTIEEARERGSDNDYCDIVDRDTWEIIE